MPFKPVAFEPYGRRRSRRPPAWLMLLLFGIVVGAVGVIVVQERYMPPRLSAGASEKLRQAYSEADAERQSLKAELAEARRQMEAAIGERKAQTDEVAASRSTIDDLRGDLAAVVAALPPDPRGSDVAVRAGRFVARGGMLSYDVVLTQEGAQNKPKPGVMQLVVSGESARGVETTVTLKPVSLSIGSHEVVRGSLPLPEGFKPHQTTIQILDKVAGRPLGMRVWLVRE